MIRLLAFGSYVYQSAVRDHPDLRHQSYPARRPSTPAFSLALASSQLLLRLHVRMAATGRPSFPGRSSGRRSGAIAVVAVRRGIAQRLALVARQAAWRRCWSTLRPARGRSRAGDGRASRHHRSLFHEPLPPVGPAGDRGLLLILRASVLAGRRRRGRLLLRHGRGDAARHRLRRCNGRVASPEPGRPSHAVTARRSRRTMLTDWVQFAAATACMAAAASVIHLSVPVTLRRIVDRRARPWVRPARAPGSRWRWICCSARSGCCSAAIHTVCYPEVVVAFRARHRWRSPQGDSADVRTSSFARRS